MVDDRQIAFRPAVEISYLSEEQQYTLLEAMSYNDATPSLAQAIKMKKFMQDGKLTDAERTAPSSDTALRSRWLEGVWGHNQRYGQAALLSYLGLCGWL